MTAALQARSLLSRHRYALGVFAACQAILLVWWIAFFPVLVSPDSLRYVVEATANQWRTDHSVVYDAMIWLSLQVTHGVALLVFLQTVAMAAVLAYLAAGLRRLGVPGWAAGVAAPLGLLTPSLGSFPVYLWKDVPFTLCSLWLLGLLVHLVDVAEQDPRWSSGRRARNGYGLSFVAVTLMCLFRNNAFVFIVIACVPLLILWRRRSLRLVGALLLGAIAAAALTVAVFPLFGVARANSDLVLGPAYDDIAYVYKTDPHALTTQDLNLMRQVAPLTHWRAAGNCYTADDLTNSHLFSTAAASAHAGQLFALWRRLAVDDLLRVTEARACRGFIAWSPVAGPRGRGNTVFPITVERRSRYREVTNPTWRRALQPAPPSPQLRSTLQRYDVASRSVQDIVWRGATWCYLLYLAVAIAIWRTRRWALLALATVSFGVQIGVLADNPNQLVRYMMVPLYAGVSMLPLAIAGRDNRASTVPGRNELAFHPGTDLAVSESVAPDRVVDRQESSRPRP